MFESREFLLRARLDAASLEAWIEAGWLVPGQAGPGQAGPGRAFSDLDLARASLIRDLREGMGVNDEGIGVVLDLLDQVHGLRHALRRLSTALCAVPEPVRQELLARLRSGPRDPSPEEG